MGKLSLCDLFAGKSQLIIYHFMLGPDWGEGCKSCSYLTDHYQGAVPHLAARDVALVAVSRAPFSEISAFKRRMGWNHPWVSSFESDFNYDYNVSFSPAEVEAGTATYNDGKANYGGSEYPGLSVFVSEEGTLYHTYSTYARGLDVFIGTYHFLDIVPKGRNENRDPHPMSWVRHHDRYDGLT